MHFEKGDEASQVAQGLSFRPGRRVTGDVLQSRKLLKVQVIGTQTKMHLLELGIVLRQSQDFKQVKKWLLNVWHSLPPTKR